ncbi:MBOAT family protein [Mesorhizobium sp. M7A.F.Ca.US.011.01.1.1]|uniref:MBOAT family O-acyltransferase n=1 Tax=Mesorhizobium sp. M7A.F.Ca.US.011.01.1.1 TaxID=2496741 RepID=UPI000FCAE11B|nr:MBOAT family protein [Mesorhizobium sp. M7A.F.Ca.US.011.01.1.1]RUX27106.1 MBOAT family protein [Mesorhizobium sp. M7A.F.Ca.US.011.01.1.1]
MVFSEPVFLFAFLPIALALVMVGGKRFTAPMVLLTSLIFYAWGSGAIVTVLVFSIVFNWAYGRVIERNRTNTILMIGVMVNVLLLLYYKYSYFISSNIDEAIGTHVSDPFKNVVLPIGISFFVFQAISYLIDIKRGDVPAERNVIIFGAYKSFFPQLIAGPIVRFRDVGEDFHNPQISMENISAGVARFVHGLLKKVVIADAAGAISDGCFAVHGADVTITVAWLGALAYAIQIYFDFSAYSDMAIGLGRIFGIRFNENFMRPYSASTVTEFWRRWHISLSTWFRDYVYIPLGGSRKGSIRTYCNLAIVFLVTGLWHGAAWTFVIWGLYHGAFLICEKLVIGNSAAEKKSQVLRIVYLLPVVIIGWIIFRADSLTQAWTFMTNLFALGELGAPLPESVAAALNPRTVLFFAIGLLIFVAPRGPAIGAWLAQDPTRFRVLSRVPYTAVGLILAGVFVLSSSFSPFLYFRF